MTGRGTVTAVTSLWLLFLTIGCSAPWSSGRSEDERLDAARASIKLSLYRPLKVAMRALPDPLLVSEASARVATASATVTSVTTAAAPSTRERWRAVAAELGRADPRYASLVDRTGLFAVATSLRALLLDIGGAFQGVPEVPGNAFGSGARDTATNLYAECRTFSGEEEDRYPAVSSALVRELRRGSAKFPPDHPVFRLDDPDFEHLVLGCAWVLAGQGPLALHELDRSKAEKLRPLEQIIHHIARIRLLSELECPSAALDELDLLEPRMEAWLATGETGRAASDPGRAKDLVEGSCAALRMTLLRQTGRKDEAKAYLDATSQRFHDRAGLGPVMHLLTAQEHIRSFALDPAKREVELAIEGIPAGELRERLVGLVESLRTRTLGVTGPTSSTASGAPPSEELLYAEITRVLDQISLEALFHEVLGSELMEGARRLAAAVRAWIDQMWASVPSREQLEKNVKGWWEKPVPPGDDFDD